MIEWKQRTSKDILKDIESECKKIYSGRRILYFPLAWFVNAFIEYDKRQPANPAIHLKEGEKDEPMAVSRSSTGTR